MCHTPRQSHSSLFLNKIILAEKYRSWSFSSGCPLHSPATCSPLGPNRHVLHAFLRTRRKTGRYDKGWQRGMRYSFELIQGLVTEIQYNLIIHLPIIRQCLLTATVASHSVGQKAVCSSYSTAALRHNLLLPEWVPSFISRGTAHTKRCERLLLAKEGTIPGI